MLIIFKQIYLTHILRLEQLFLFLDTMNMGVISIKEILERSSDFFVKMYADLVVFKLSSCKVLSYGGVYLTVTCGVTVIVVGNEFDDQSSNSARGYLHFPFAIVPFGKPYIHLSFPSVIDK